MRATVLTLLAIVVTMPMAGAQDLPAFAAFDKASDQVLADPHDLAFGPDGLLYVADKFGGRIAVFDPDSLELKEMVFEGQLPGVHDISFGPNGQAAVAVTGLNLVAVFSDIVNRTEDNYALAAPRAEGALAHSNGRIYAMASGLGTLIAYQGTEVMATAEGHPGAHDVAEAPDGSIWVADNFNRRLVKYSPDLEQLQVLNDRKFGFVGPRYMDIDGFGRLVVADQDAHRVLLIDPEGPNGGTLIGVIGDGIPGFGPNKFDDPEGVAIRGSDYFIADSDNNRIVRYSVAIN